VSDGLQRRRVLAGQCPNCGKDAAPYRFCVDHRALQSLGRAMERMRKAGVLSKTKTGRANAWYATPGSTAALAAMPRTAMPLWGEGRADDKRLQPKLRGVRVDVEQTLIDILRGIGRPASVEEIQAAWGRLRGERKHGSLAADIKVIIAAKRAREAKALRRAAAYENGRQSSAILPPDVGA
jgi:hypothetical protein